MKFIRNILKKVKLAMNDDVSFMKPHVIMSHLAHDLNNDFINMRLITQMIQKNAVQSENSIIEDKLSSINKILDSAKINLEMVRLLTLPENNKPSDIEKFSVHDCINNAINTYPFPAKKYMSCFQIKASDTDLLVSGNKHLLTYGFYLLIRNMIKYAEIEKSSVLITFESVNNKIYVHIKMPATNTEKNIYSLGLPSDYGHGFLFIKSAVKGDAFYNLTSENDFIITLQLPLANSLKQN